MLFSAACNDSFPVPPTVPATHTTINISAPATAPLVAFRDGFDSAWSNAAKGGAGYTADVTGPYEVAVVCQINGGTTWLTWEHADVPNGDDDTTTNLTAPCDAAPATHLVTGTVPAGSTVSLGGAHEVEATAGTFSIAVPNGKYDIVVRTATTVAISTAPVTVNGADVPVGTVALGPTITLKDTTFSPKNPAGTEEDDAEMYTVTTLLKTANSPDPSVVFIGTATADPNSEDAAVINSKVIPAASLPKGTTQQITMSASHRDETTDGLVEKGAEQTLERSTNRNFNDGDLTTIALPDGYGSVVWNPNADPAGLSFISDSDSLDIQTATVTGVTSENKTAVETIELLSEFFSETSLARVIIATDIPGYQATWKVDTSKQYTRTTQGLARVDDKGTDPETHDNREVSSSQVINGPLPPPAP
ncbi:MAG TPA: hypothetical protein VFP84_29140 [Kofleriaceae bacterium]|nr:hypothetical protein [Kofleriaceae bacterium]